MNKQQLASKIWESANKMRSKIEANEYKDYILGFIFYKFLSDKEVAFLRKEGMTDDEFKALSEEDKETVKFCQDNVGYFIAYENLFSTWLEKDRERTFDIANVRDALSAFDRLISKNHRKVFEKIFDTLQVGLKKLGETSGAQTKAVAGLLNLIRDIPMDGRQDYDVLGFIYEYLISNFAANAGKKAGEFYTPHEVSVMMSEIIADHLKDRDKIEIYDPTSGSGSLLINIGRSVSKYVADRNKIKYYAQELKANTYNLTRMNLVMRGILPDNIVTRNGDTLEDDWPMFDESDPHGTYHPLYVDAVVSNPPYSQNWLPDPAKRSDPRYSYGMAPKSKADYAFLLHDLYHLKPDGIMTIVLPHGVLFRGDEEGEIRKNLIENNHISAIIGLPPDIFFGTGIPTIVMVLRKRRTDEGVLFVDASHGFVKSGKKNKLRASDIRRIADTVIARRDVPKYSRLVSRDIIRANDYNLNIPRYIDSSDAPETWDLYATMSGGIPQSEINALADYWRVLPGLRETLFAMDASPYARLAEGEIAELIRNAAKVKAFKRRFSQVFADLDVKLEDRLITHLKSVSVAQEERVIAEDIFNRLKDIPLVDPYDAYEKLDAMWLGTSNDLEMLQEEGFDAVRKVDPNLVIKKKDGKEQEVQDGWVGHIVPFALVQETLLKDAAEKIAAQEALQEESVEKLSALIADMGEEDKEKYLNDDNDAFDAKSVAARVEEIFAERFPNKKVKKADRLAYLAERGSFAAESGEGVLIAAAQGLAAEKALKAKIKEMKAELDAATKTAIENLSDADAKMLLKRKWIDPLVADLAALPDAALATLETKVKALGAKYAETFRGVEDEMRTAEKELGAMLGDLTGGEYDLKALAAVREALA